MKIRKRTIKKQSNLYSFLGGTRKDCRLKNKFYEKQQSKKKTKKNKQRNIATYTPFLVKQEMTAEYKTNFLKSNNKRRISKNIKKETRKDKISAFQ